MKTAILASQNRKKIKEIQVILERFGMYVITRDDAGLPKDEIEETGSSFEENSMLKARGVLDMIEKDPALADKYSGSPVIADDSGLMVDALGGAPGVYSARYAGEDGNAEKNNTKLLAELEGVPKEQRSAHFSTVITMIFPGGDVIIAKGECRGHIAEELKGEGGFGYDPLFIPDGYDKSFAELGTDFKNSISHRARALAELDRLLQESGQSL